MRNRVVIIVLLCSVLLLSIPSLRVTADEEPKKIVFDYSHGQYRASVQYIDLHMAGNLTAMGYEVVFATGGLNSTILSDATGLVISSIYGEENGFGASEISAISSWYNSGRKFMWIGADADYDGQYINGNMSLILETVGSHVYPEPTFVKDQISNANAEYRVIATGTSSNPIVNATGVGVTAVQMHGPTLLYGSNNENPGPFVNPVALEDTTISAVYPILYYNESAFIEDSDFTPPIAHTDMQQGAFVASTMEFGLGPGDDNVLVVSGASPYGDYMPMYADEYLGYHDGYNLVLQAIELGIESTYAYEQPKKIVFDYSHGQYSLGVEYIDLLMAGNLTDMGYEVVFATGGLNSSILSDASGLVIGAIYGEENGFLASEISAIASWYNTDNKFLWIGMDSDYSGVHTGQFINNNMTLILEAVGSHVYGEPTSVVDPISKVEQEYRVIATGTSLDPMVMTTGIGVNAVLMHGPTLLYGSNSAAPGEDVSAVALETTEITDVYPILYYNESARIQDTDLQLPYVHTDTEEGAFVAATMEFGLGPDEDNVLVVSGSSPYGYYQPMYSDTYYEYDLTGHLFVLQTIDLGMHSMYESVAPTIVTSHTGLQAEGNVFVNATITDESNITVALLLYSFDGMVTVENMTMSHVSGDIWTASIPWPGYNVSIQYQVVAEDIWGNLGVSSIDTIGGITTPIITSTSTTTTPEPTTSISATTTSEPTTSTSTTTTPMPTQPDMTVIYLVIIGGLVIVIIILVVIVTRRR
ncbi:MAG: hypothetical protein RTU92_05220 [Candidatus Thorarchaeota archaeon]